ncbi:hypothetical protein E8E13_006960 [Curvularia kusanoi]|uniref:F-box domain-containing protein n=1 Tax=Curvularia kusanoi TaxID=90978 RepID=A0A9P4TCZ9_CURKU|nr:hypothetical protein E8E13_006960 [Curvularia kusanoi]
MADPHGLNSLPPELQAMVFELLPIPALKAMRLVSKQYSSEATKALWKDTKIKIDLESSRSLDDLLVEYPSGFIDSVRQLSIDTVSCNWSLSAKIARDILNKLPLDHLRIFQSRNSKVSREALGVLLEKQTRLSSLLICPDLFPEECFNYGGMDNLQSLHIIWHNTRNSGFIVDRWLRLAPRLEDLTMEAKPIQQALFSLADCLNLQRLTLCGLDLSELSANSLPTVSLKALELNCCKGSRALLQSVASHNKQGSGTHHLISFIWRNRGYDAAWPNATEVLQSAEGLSKIVIDIDYADVRAILSNIGPSAGTLEELQYTTTVNDFSTRQLEFVVPSCRKLKRLTISPKLFEPRPGDIVPAEPRFNPEPLKIISKISSLRRLSLILLFLDGQGYAAEELKSKYAYFADETINLLAQAGSGIETLDFGPPDRTSWYDHHKPDDNGHTYPYYSYKVGRITETCDGGQKSVKFVAIPIPAAPVEMQPSAFR